jgi:hypothetical protein
MAFGPYIAQYGEFIFDFHKIAYIEVGLGGSVHVYFSGVQDVVTVYGDEARGFVDDYKAFAVKLGGWLLNART